MLTKEQNDKLTQIGPGTPCGELMRRYWFPIAATAQMKDKWAMPVRVLGEDLALYKDLKGAYGLVDQRCPHRNMNLAYGVPEQDGLRCCYHGWVFDATGQCIEQPAEPSGSNFKDKIKIPAYPVEELGGLIFAYLGPLPAPVLPRWDLLVWDNVERLIESIVIPCNWLQSVENTIDRTHVEWLHGYYGMRVLQQQGKPWEALQRGLGRHHVKIGYDRFEYGMIKRHLYPGDTEDVGRWRIGHPLLFPTITRQGQERHHHFEFRTPIDDTHLLHFFYELDVPEPGVTVQQPEYVPWREKVLYGNDGSMVNDNIHSQDAMVWAGQGPVSDRTKETLGVGDIGVIMYRRLLEEQMKIVEDGGEPINVHREHKDIILLPQEDSYYPGHEERGGPFKDVVLTKVAMERSLL